MVITNWMPVRCSKPSRVRVNTLASPTGTSPARSSKWVRGADGSSARAATAASASRLSASRVRRKVYSPKFTVGASSAPAAASK